MAFHFVATFPSPCSFLPGCIAQSVTCLVTDAKLTTDPGVASSIQARSHTFVEIDHEIISTVILLPSTESFMKGCCQLQAKVCARLLVNCLLYPPQTLFVVGILFSRCPSVCPSVRASVRNVLFS